MDYRLFIEGCFYSLTFGTPREVPDGDVLYRRFSKVMPGIEPGITLPRKGNLPAQYCPKKIEYYTNVLF